MLPRKLLYLVDLLFHAMCIGWDALVVTAFFHCPTGVCHASLLTISVSVVYHLCTLCTYYRWMTVSPAEKQLCLFGLCANQLQLWLQRGPAKPQQQHIQMQENISGGGQCSATFEFSQHAFETSTVASQRLTSRGSISSDVLMG